MTFGATYLGDNRTRFRLWAPGQKAVAVEIEGRPGEERGNDLLDRP